MILPGKLIEYLDNGRFFCALVCEDTGKRLRLLNQNGREVNLPPARVVHCSARTFALAKPREELLRQLKEAAEKRQALMSSINLQEIWELTTGETVKNFTPHFLAGLCFGEAAADDDKIAALLRSVFADRLFFKYREGEIIAHPADLVEKLQAQQEKERQQAEFLNDCAAGLLKIRQDQEVDPAAWPARDRCLQLLKDYYLFGGEAPDSDLARELLKKADLNREHDSFYLLVKAGIWDKNENIFLLRKEIPTTFPKAVSSFARNLPIFEDAAADRCIDKKRKDFRSLPLFTIDGAATRDFDDALHLEKSGPNYLVGIHVADVAHYVTPGDPLFQETLKRGTSIYFPEGVVPMLPPDISEQACSLIAGQPRLAMSFLVLLSPEGLVLEYEIIPSVVTVKRQLRYNEADLLVENDEELGILSRLSQKLRQRRLEAGALLLPFPEVHIRIGPADDIGIKLVDPDTPSRVLIAEFMILANTLAAQYVTEREAPGLFKSQPPPHQRLVHGLDKDLFTNMRQRKNLARADLRTNPKPHSGIGASQYTTITSPIRRLLDLIMQHQIYNLVTGKGPLFSKEELNNFAATITTTSAAANQVKQLRHRYWVLKYLEGRIGERINCLIIDKNPRRLQVLLVDFLLDAELPPRPEGSAAPGKTVAARIARVNALDNLLRLEW